MDLYERAHRPMALEHYATANQQVSGVPLDVRTPSDQYVLRMCVRAPGTVLALPPELEWMRDTIALTDRAQSVLGVSHPFMYLTVRCGPLRSERDDEWHADGFSMRVPHAPEQNYIWSDCFATEVLEQNFSIPADFDPLRHNVHQYFADNVRTVPRALAPRTLYQIDPYIVHRRPRIPSGTQRAFFRVSHVAIEIQDDRNTPNPLLPRPNRGRPDIRDSLIRYVPQ